MLRIGSLELSSPVVLAPMAGVTNAAFRVLCREQELARVGAVSGLYVCEMVTARALAEEHPATLDMMRFAPTETPRSVQLYTVDPEWTYRAARLIVDRDMADHIDMNFGCPVPKVTRRGGGSALPYKRRLYRDIVRAAVRATAGTNIPVTVKFRVGIDDDHITYLDAGRIAEDEGAAAVALHGRTAAERYAGHAHWDTIATLKEHVTSIPVLGNGDIFAATDAAAMMEQTGCDGVVVGRGCLGRPWLFAQIHQALAGDPISAPPTLGEVTAIMVRHAELLAEFHGELKGCRDLRKHIAWYLHGYPAGRELRQQLSRVSTVEEITELLAPFADSPAMPENPDAPRGRQGSVAAKVTLPDGWLDDPEQEGVVVDDHDLHSGG
ncbi:MAG: tRNA dihydrouridine synthase DusB [Lawsonella sp.]|uniref:tRNA dihydrouridine synthase DusB n=1 Tax=Lawsonella sp. TaxID=2041415 RepID=UPI002A747E3C|nr:tRNA dihydrouridine synthase DusB [Lawsonella sp.]MDY2978898.1 tRNA dihydrouridine synthase DusB [Lawsonella sp.]